VLSKCNYFGDDLGEGVEAIKNIHHGLQGGHPIDVPSSVSLLHETYALLLEPLHHFSLDIFT
jgi:hypothetical protein